MRHEKVKPYFLAGDRDGRVNRWLQWELYKGINKVIKCEQSDGTTYSATITLSYDSDPPSMADTSPSPSPSSSASFSSTPSVSVSPLTTPGVMDPPTDNELGPGSLLLHPSGLIGDILYPISNGMTFCPEEFPFGEFTVQCVESDTSTSALFLINGSKAKSESVAPYFVAGDAGGKAYAWHGYPMDEPFTLSCQLSDGVTSTVTMTVMCEEDDEDPRVTDEDISVDGVMTTQTGCVIINAKASTLSDDWLKTDEGLIFRPHVDATYVASAGKSPLSYQFTAPVTTQYAFIIDMTTAHSTEHNDVWASFPAGGFQLLRGGIINEDERKGQGWTKVYHNGNGRELVSSTVDFAAHSMATKELLNQGVSYEVLLSGRSSKVEVHRIIMFPCEGSGCQRASTNWRNRLAECAAL